MSLNFSLPQVIAHRGESGLAPENTLAAFELAARNGATWVELDAKISADDVPFVHHDDSINRCTTGTGLLNLYNSEALRSVDAGSWYGEQFEGEPLPELTAVITLLTHHNMGLNLELKPSAGWEARTTEAVCALLQQSWPADAALLISSFSETALARAAELLPNVPRGYLVGGVPGDWQERMRELNCDTLHCSANKLNKITAREIKDAGYGLLCYTVNDAARARQLLDWGVDSVITDYPSTLLADLPA